MSYFIAGYIFIALLVAAWMYHDGESQEMLDKLYEDKVMDSMPSQYHRPIFYFALTMAAIWTGATWPYSVGRKLYRKLSG